jgi:hypothetical protein
MGQGARQENLNIISQSSCDVGGIGSAYEATKHLDTVANDPYGKPFRRRGTSHTSGNARKEFPWNTKNIVNELSTTVVTASLPPHDLQSNAHKPFPSSGKLSASF